jgi:hypothetical protein
MTYEVTSNKQQVTSDELSLSSWCSAIQWLSFPLSVNGERDEEEGFGNGPIATLASGDVQPCYLFPATCYPRWGEVGPC